jgi:riboflavin kinase/FMN adenylyltransferase
VTPEVAATKKIIANVEDVERGHRRTAVTIGAFDGIHLGHRRILEEVVLLSRALGVEGVAVTFDPHPISVIQPHEGLFLLTSLEEKLALMESIGVDKTLVFRFDGDLARRSADWFARRVLVERLGIKRLVIGYDFRFGRAREGGASSLKGLGEELGFGVDIVPPVEFMGHPVSSTRVRTALLRGDVESARAMLGRPYSMSGVVIKGQGRGRLLDFPTANLKAVDREKMLPAPGVYAVKVLLDMRPRRGALYIGTRPTFGEGPAAIEVHILDMDDDLYGRRLGLEFVERLRGEVGFEDGASLKKAIETDVDRVRRSVTI